LTLDPAQRARRALLAAQAELQAGGFEAVEDMLSIADSSTLTEEQRAQMAMLRAQLAFLTSRGSDAPGLLLDAASRLESLDPSLSRATYLDAFMAAIFAGRLAAPDGDIRAVARLAANAPTPTHARAPDLLLEGTAAVYNEGYATAAPRLRTALAQFGKEMSAEEELRLLYMAGITAIRLWDADQWEALASRHLELARETGAISELHLALTLNAYVQLFAGDLIAAAAIAAEVKVSMEASGTHLAPYVDLGLAAFRGDQVRGTELVARTNEDVAQRGEGIGITFAEWAYAVLNNGLGRYTEAHQAAERAASYQPDLASLVWILPEQIEAGVRSGAPECARSAWDRLDEMTAASGTDWALGIRARSQALLVAGESAERLYRTAIGHLEGTRLRVDLARAHLLYGEWLRRERRQSDSREQLKMALSMFTHFGMSGFAERAERELRAAGGTTRNRAAPAAHTQLTAQEIQIARMAADGLSNPEIATRLYISARTVQYHLGKVFTKLGITSRRQLDGALADAEEISQQTARPEPHR
jgi:DNA-binding CsgD family transcriptional regulator